MFVRMGTPAQPEVLPCRAHEGNGRVACGSWGRAGCSKPSQPPPPPPAAPGPASGLAWAGLGRGRAPPLASASLSDAIGFPCSVAEGRGGLLEAERERLRGRQQAGAAVGRESIRSRVEVELGLRLDAPF